jgi:hypothetical protein
MVKTMEDHYKECFSEQCVRVSKLETKAAFLNEIAVAFENALDWCPEHGWTVVKPELIDRAFTLQQIGGKNGIL